jgi:hypothetical protein
MNTLVATVVHLPPPSRWEIWVFFTRSQSAVV